MKLLLALLLTCASLPAFSQVSNELRVYYGFFESALLRNGTVIGDGSYENQGSYEFGVKYLKALSNNWSIQTGVNFLKSTVKITPAFSGRTLNPSYEDLKLLSIPALINYSIGRYFEINGGPVLSLQLGEKDFDNQSGVGYFVGIVAKYPFQRGLIYLAPYFKRHALIPFRKEPLQQRLTQLGVQLGIGYPL